MIYLRRNIHGLEWENNDDLEYNQQYSLCEGIARAKMFGKFLPCVTFVNMEDEKCACLNEFRKFLKSNVLKKIM